MFVLNLDIMPIFQELSIAIIEEKNNVTGIYSTATHYAM